MNEENSMEHFIKNSVQKAKKLVTGKTIAEQNISSIMSTIAKELDDKVEFTKDEFIDKDEDALQRIFVKNKITGTTEFLFYYYFNKETVFPMMINYQNILMSRCHDLNELNSYMKELISDERFMLKIVMISELDDPFTDDIPF